MNIFLKTLALGLLAMSAPMLAKNKCLSKVYNGIINADTGYTGDGFTILLEEDRAVEITISGTVYLGTITCLGEGCYTFAATRNFKPDAQANFDVLTGKICFGANCVASITEGKRTIYTNTALTTVSGTPEAFVITDLKLQNL